MSNYTAQNTGAGKLSRIREGFRAGVKMIWTLCAPLVFLYLAAAKILVTFFIHDPSELALASGAEFLYIVSPFYFIVSVKLVADGILRGAGRMKHFMTATFTDLLLRVALAKILAGRLGYLGIWCAWPIGWTISMALSVYFYRRGPWKISG